MPAPVTTKQVVAELSQGLFQKGAQARGANDMTAGSEALAKFGEDVCRKLIETFGGNMQTAEGLVALGFTTARFAAPALLATVKTREELTKQLVFITDLVSTTVRMGLESAWAATNGKEKEQHSPLLVTVPGGQR